MHVKICGITRPEDARTAEAAGADAIGLVFAPSSKRYVSPERAAEIAAAVGPIARVGVFVNAPLGAVRDAVHALKLSAVQLHGQEGEAYASALRSEVTVIKAFSFHPGLSREVLRGFPADALLLDGLKPGGGERFDWAQAASLRGLPRLVLAGGLTPQNVAAGIAALRPYAVDSSSGVESRPGIKDAQKIQDFVRAAKRAALSTVIHNRPPTCG